MAHKHKKNPKNTNPEPLDEKTYEELRELYLEMGQEFQLEGVELGSILDAAPLVGFLCGKCRKHVSGIFIYDRGVVLSCPNCGNSEYLYVPINIKTE